MGGDVEESANGVAGPIFKAIDGEPCFNREVPICRDGDRHVIRLGEDDMAPDGAAGAGLSSTRRHGRLPPTNDFSFVMMARRAISAPKYCSIQANLSPSADPFRGSGSSESRRRRACSVRARPPRRRRSASASGKSRRRSRSAAKAHPARDQTQTRFAACRGATARVLPRRRRTRDEIRPRGHHRGRPPYCPDP